MPKTRAQKAPSASLVTRLNDDVMLLVFEQLLIVDKPSLKNAALVCKRWSDPVQRILDNTLGPLVISTNFQPRTNHVLERLKSSAAFRRRVHNIHIGEWHVYSTERHELDPPLRKRGRRLPDPSPFDPKQFLSSTWDGCLRRKDPTWRTVRLIISALKLQSFCSFRWSAVPCMPWEMVHALQEHQPGCEVLIEENHAAKYLANWLYTPLTNYYSLHTLDAIAGNLHQLDLSLLVAETALWPLAGALIRNSPLLTSVQVYAVPNIAQHGNASRPFNLRHMPHYEQTLTMRSLEWLLGDGGPSGSDVTLQLRQLSLVNFCICECSNGPALSALCASLSNATVDCITIAQNVVSNATHLTAFSLTTKSTRPGKASQQHFIGCTAGIGNATTHELLMRCGDLQRLTLINQTAAVDREVISRLPQLRSLHLHEWTHPVDKDHTRSFLTADTISCMGAACPDLKTLAIDIPLDHDETTGHLQMLAQKLPTLRKLTICRPVEFVIDNSLLIRPGEVPKIPLSANSFLIGNAKRFFDYFSRMGGRLNSMSLRTSSLPPLRATYIFGHWRSFQQTICIDQCMPRERQVSQADDLSIYVLGVPDIIRRTAEGAYDWMSNTQDGLLEAQVNLATYGPRCVPIDEDGCMSDQYD